MLADLQLHVGSWQVLDLASTHYCVGNTTLHDGLFTLRIPEHALLCPKQRAQIKGAWLIDPCTSRQQCAVIHMLTDVARRISSQSHAAQHWVLCQVAQLAATIGNKIQHKRLRGPGVLRCICVLSALRVHLRAPNGSLPVLATGLASIHNT